MTVNPLRHPPGHRHQSVAGLAAVLDRAFFASIGSHLRRWIMRQPGSESQSPASAVQGTGVQLPGGRIRTVRVTWAIFEIATQSLVCERCVTKWPVVFPISATGIAGLCRVFENEHRRCVEPSPKGDRS